MDQVELNKTLNELVSGIRKRLNLSVENAVAVVMLSNVANNLQKGLMAGHSIDSLINALMSEI